MTSQLTQEQSPQFSNKKRSWNMGMLQEKKKETEKMLTQVDRKLKYEYWNGEGAFPILAVVTASRTLFFAS